MGQMLRNSVRDTKAFIAWAKEAQPRDWCVYHIGTLTRDRIDNVRVTELADTVGVLASTGWVVTSQNKVSYPAIEGSHYVATRTGAGYAPSALMTGKITGFQYRLLEVLNRRQAHESAARVIREATSLSDKTAKRLLRDLEDDGLVELLIDGAKLTRKGVGALS